MTKVLAGRLAGMFHARRVSNLTTITAGLIALSTATLGFAFALALLPVVVLRVTSIDGVLTPWAIDTTDLALVASRSALASMALSGVAFLAWLRRTVAATPAGRRGRVPTPARAVGWWFVPVVNLVRPYSIVRDLHDDLAVAGRPAAPIRAWWTCFVVAVVPSVVALAGGWLAGFYVAVAVLPLVAGYAAVSRLAPGLSLPLRLALVLPAASVVLAAVAGLAMLGMAAIIVSASPSGGVEIDALMVESIGIAIALAIGVMAVAAGILAIRVVLEIDRRAMEQTVLVARPSREPLRAAA